MAQYNVDVFVDAPVERVFEACADLRGAPERCEGIKALEVLTDGPIGVGTRFKETRVMFGKECTEEMEITGFEENKRYTVEAESCGSKWGSEMRCDPEGAGTRLTLTMHCQALTLGAKIMSAVMAPMMKGMMLKCVRKDLEGIKAAVEANGA